MDQHANRLEVEDLLYREAYYLDTRDWDAWLALYTDDAKFWMPAWVSEDRLASDPETEMSMIYCDGIEMLADRVFRIRTEDSFASTPLPRSCHVLGNVLLLDAGESEIVATAAWTVHQYLAEKGSRVHGGRYEYGLRREQGILRIAVKKIIFLNDAVDVPIDVYNI